MKNTTEVPFSEVQVGQTFQFATGVAAVKLDDRCARVTGGNFSFIDRVSPSTPVAVSR